MARTGKRQPSRSNARTCSSVSTLGMASRLLVGSGGPARRDLFAPRLHGRAQRGELAHAARHPSKNGVDGGALGRGEIELRARVVGVHLRWRAGAHQRGADRGMTERPGEGDLAQGHAARLGNLATEPLDDAKVWLK